MEKVKTRIFRFSNFFLKKKNRTVYEIMWKNTVKPESSQATIQNGACVLHAG
jgi:hypothetical protein